MNKPPGLGTPKLGLNSAVITRDLGTKDTLELVSSVESKEDPKVVYIGLVWRIYWVSLDCQLDQTSRFRSYSAQPL